jgi:hypothetical protein
MAVRMISAGARAARSSKGQQGTGAAVEALGQQDRAHRTAADWQNAERD